MPIDVNVKTRFRYNGKVYDSLEELPEDVRQAYERATAGSAAGLFGGAPAATAKVVFNGTEYDGPDAMPPQVRTLYESVIRAVETGHPQGGEEPLIAGLASGAGTGAQPGPYVSAAPIEPGSGSSRSTPIAFVLGLVVFLLLLGLYLYTSAVPK